MTTIDFNNVWDAELEQLAARVTEMFGEVACVEAVDRAHAALLVSEAQSSLTPEQIAEYRAALKTALRRLITPQ
jgi:hypothetical protein